MRHFAAPKLRFVNIRSTLHAHSTFSCIAGICENKVVNFFANYQIEIEIIVLSEIATAYWNINYSEINKTILRQPTVKKTAYHEKILYTKPRVAKLIV